MRSKSKFMKIVLEAFFLQNMISLLCLKRNKTSPDLLFFSVVLYSK